MSLANSILTKMKEAKSDTKMNKLDKMLGDLDASLVASNTHHILLRFKDNKWILYTNEVDKYKNIPGRAVFKINIVDGKTKEVETLIRKLIK